LRDALIWGNLANMDQARAHNDELAQSQLSLRKGLGLMGLALPIVLFLASALNSDVDLRRSLSAYYYAPHLRDMLVGVLWAIGATLVFYRGYGTIPTAFRRLPAWINRHMTDTKLSSLAGIGALMTAIMPTCEFQDNCPTPIIAGGHLVGSITFLGTLAILSIWSFTDSNTPPQDWDASKKWANRIYITSGWTILASLALCAPLVAYRVDAIGPLPMPVFWLESLAIWAFGISWLVKGDAIDDLISLLHKKKPRASGRDTPSQNSRAP
jgi:hypothetical protein